MATTPIPQPPTQVEMLQLRLLALIASAVSTLAAQGGIARPDLYGSLIERATQLVNEVEGLING